MKVKEEKFHLIDKKIRIDEMLKMRKNYSELRKEKESKEKKSKLKSIENLWKKLNPNKIIDPM